MFSKYGSWEALDGCKILLQVVGTICPLGKSHSVKKKFNLFFRPSKQCQAIDSREPGQGRWKWRFQHMLYLALLGRPKKRLNFFFTEWAFPSGQIVPTTCRSILHPSRASQLPYLAKIRFFRFYWLSRFFL